MIEILYNYSSALFLIVFAGCVWFAGFWQFRVRPLRIPASEIAAIADALIAEHGERADEVAFANEHRAWYESDLSEQGKWRRVRNELKQRVR